MSLTGRVKLKMPLNGERSQVVSQDIMSGGARTMVGFGNRKMEKWLARARRWVGPKSGMDGSETRETLEINVDRITEYEWGRGLKEDESTDLEPEGSLSWQEPEPNGGRTTIKENGGVFENEKRI